MARCLVGVGDAIGAESKSNLFQTIRADGVIVKPDVPIVPIDALYLSDAQSTNGPMVAATHSQFSDSMKALYVFAYARGGSTQASFKPTLMGIPGNAYVYNYFTGAGTIVPAGQFFTDNVSSGSYYIVVPIGVRSRPRFIVSCLLILLFYHPIRLFGYALGVVK